MNAIDVQVGGNHYQKFNIQPIELIASLGLNFFQGNIFKYVTRYKYKNGIEDLKKAIHYCDLAEQYHPYTWSPVNKDDKAYEWIEANKDVIDRDFYEKFIPVLYYGFYEEVKKLIEGLIDNETK